ncbi:MAG: DUF1361 domain-containing protein [Anaerolineales bacterium]|nr:DUF1361 domain-containing protein [Anaerolineales bacterium]
MIRKFLDYFSHNKYRLTMFVLLASSSVISVAVWRVRAEYSETSNYAFMIWNLFLAWIPFLISYFTYTATLSRKWVYLIVPIAAFFWLIFFPNAPYMLTDFQHLATDWWSNVPIWYDVLLLIWFSFTGLLLGVVSLFLMQEVIRREFGHWVGWAFVAIVAALSGIGVYVGRFLNWNSWDIFHNPTGIALFTIQSAQEPSLRSIGFTSLFTAFFLFLYITLYTFGHLLLERQPQPPLGE